MSLQHTTTAIQYPMSSFSEDFDCTNPLIIVGRSSVGQHIERFHDLFSLEYWKVCVQ